MIATSHSRESKLSGRGPVTNRVTPLAVSNVITWSQARISAFRSILENLCSSKIPESSGSRSSYSARSMTWPCVSPDSVRSFCSAGVSPASGDSEYRCIESLVGSKKSGP